MQDSHVQKLSLALLFGALMFVGFIVLTIAFAPTPEAQTSLVSSSLAGTCATYDGNGDGTLTPDEVNNAFDDLLNDKITVHQFVEVLDCRDNPPTPTPTATATATATAVANPQCGVVNNSPAQYAVPDVGQPAIRRTINGEFDINCLHGVTNKPMKHHLFNLAKKAHIIIDLESTKDSKLILRDFSGVVQQVNDNNDEEASTYRHARVAMQLPAGSYIIDTTVSSSETVSASTPYTLKIEVSHAIPALGHQADHTVGYILNFPGIPTPTPTPRSGTTPPPPRPPSPPPVPVDTPTPIPVDTPTPIPVDTPTPIPVDTPTPIPVDTPTPIPVDTPTPIPVDTPTPIPVDTPTPIPVDTPTPIPVDTPTPIPVDTPTPIPVDTPTPIPVDTPTPTPTPKLDCNGYGYNSPLGANCPTATPTPRPTATPTPRPDCNGYGYNSPLGSNCPTATPTPYHDHGGDGLDSEVPSYDDLVPPILDPNVTPSIPNTDDHFATVVPSGIAAWNTAVSRSWPNLLFCDIRDPDCFARNTDGQYVLAQMVEGEEEGPDSDSVHCGWAPACAIVHRAYLVSNPVSHPDNHIAHVAMRFEEPAWGYSTKYSMDLKYEWTDIKEHHGQIFVEAGKPYMLAHLKTTVMHEFGHAAGLDDLYKYKDENGDSLYPGYLMEYQKGESIPAKDRAYIEQLYRNRYGAKPHDFLLSSNEVEGDHDSQPN